MTDLSKAAQAPVNGNIPEMRTGDTVNVHVKIREGDRERIQEFRGTVIRLRKGGNEAAMTVRRMASNGVGVERTFLLRSPGSRKWSWNGATRCGTRSSISCEAGRASRPNSNRNSSNLEGQGRRQLRPSL